MSTAADNPRNERAAPVCGFTVADVYDYSEDLAESVENPGMKQHIQECLKCKAILDGFVKAANAAKQMKVPSSTNTKNSRSAAIPAAIGDFKILSLIAEGGMGRVFKAYDPSLDRLLALKVMKDELSNNARFCERFMLEAKSLAKLNHPNIVFVHTVGRHEGLLFIAMELVEGQPLTEKICDRRIGMEEAVQIFCQILEGVNAAHKHHIIHRDIKPANIMISNTGAVKVLDFGLAKEMRMDASNTFTTPGAVLGTLAYLAPEIVMGGKATAQSDIYALGLVFYQMLTGKLPYADTSESFKLIERIKTEALPSPSALNREIPPYIEQLIMKMCAKKPEERYQTIATIVQDLSRSPGVSPGQEAPPKRKLSNKSSAVINTLSAPAEPSRSAVRNSSRNPSPYPDPQVERGSTLKILYCTNCGARVASAEFTRAPDGMVYCSKCAPLFEYTSSALMRVSAVQAAIDSPNAIEVPPAVTKFYFCETCGKRITDKQILEGLGRDKKLKGVYCKDCAVGVLTMEMDAINIEQLAKAKPKTAASGHDEGRPRRASGIIRSHDVPQRHLSGKAASAAKPDRLPVLLAIGAIVVVGIVVVAALKNQAAPGDHAREIQARTPAKPSPPLQTTPSEPPAPPVASVPEHLPISPTPLVPNKNTKAASDTPKVVPHDETTQPIPTVAPAQSVEPAASQTTEAKRAPDPQPAAVVPINKGREQFSAILKELAPIARQNHFTAAQELLDAKRRDPAFAAAAELINKEKADLVEVQAIRDRAMEALRAKAGTVVSLKKGTMTGTVKVEPNKDGVALALKEGPELTVTIGQLDADDANNLLPPEAGKGNAEDLRRRGLLFLAAGEAARAEEYFVKVRDAGLGVAVTSYLERIAVLKLEVREAAALDAWKKAEDLFANKNWQTAKQAYETLQREYAGSAALANNALTLKERLEAIGWALGPPKEISLNLGEGVKMDLELIPAGEFEMGSNDGRADEKPVHKVKISQSIYMGKYVVTQAQYEKVMGKNPSHFKGEILPVEMVNYIDAEEFCKKASKLTGKLIKLPTEAEWEYACRAATKTKYNTGDNDAALEQAGWSKSNSEGKTHPVGQKKPNAWGLYDMHGNVWQWCKDWYGDDYYGKSEAENPQGPAQGALRVLRGGSWFLNPMFCRSAGRLGNDPVNRYNIIGFRVVVVPASRTP